MTTEQTTESSATPESIKPVLLSYLKTKTKTVVPVDHDLFASGLLSSMFAMELVVYLEKTFQVAIVGADLKLDNFRTVEKMIALVLRLQGASSSASGA